MHPLHDAIAGQLAEELKRRKVVVWYDPRADFVPFVEELQGGPRATAGPLPVSVAGVPALLAESTGSLFELRAQVEPHVSGDTPEAVILYLPGAKRDHQASVLMELEKAGAIFLGKDDPNTTPLQWTARQALRQRYTEGVVDEMLAREGLTYSDLARMCAVQERPSVLKVLFHEAKGDEGVLAVWLASDRRDADLVAKGAVGELRKLALSHLGLDLPEEADLPKLRAITLRYVLAGEFRSDLRCPPPASLASVPAAPSPKEEAALRSLARHLRQRFADAYAELADRVERELGLQNATLPAGSLGAIDTFRFEERALLGHCGGLIAEGKFETALELVGEREHSFWLDRDVARKAQWEACRRMAELGSVAMQVRGEVGQANGDANRWVQSYTAKDGWYRLDQAQRRLEAWVANLDDDPEERPLGIVRRRYEDACQAMAEGFTKALAASGWTSSAALHQTKIFSEVVVGQPKPVAYFLVDAMRFEMGVELAERLPTATEVSVRPALGVLPSITPIGMAALQPGAAGSFNVVEQGGKLGAKIDEVFLPDLAARKKFATARLPKLVDLTLDDLLGDPPKKLGKKLEGAQIVVVRSQEIDSAGEGGFPRQARQVMDTVIDNLARAIRKLAREGVEQVVVTADHGHLYFPRDRDESMRTEAPGGATVDLHRRCWIGRGGATPPGCIRVAASALGYASDLDLIFPNGTAVFKSGGDLAFHHGGPTLQELIVPVLTVRTMMLEPEKSVDEVVAVSGLPDVVTNRIFSVTLVLAEEQLALGDGSGAQEKKGRSVRPILVYEGRQVGTVGVAVEAELDRATGCVLLEPRKPVTIAFLLGDESAESLRVVVQDPATDAELYRSPKNIPVRLGV